jgi:hypothetical protein
MKTRSVLVGLASVAAVAALGVASVSKADTAQVVTPLQGLPLCGGNQDQKPAPVTCTNSKTFTFGTVQRTVTVVLNVPVGGAGSTVTYTLDKPAPAAFPIRVVAHEGLSGQGLMVDSDVSGTFPAGSVGPVVLTFNTGCGQIDIKAVFTANGDSRGRVGAPYVCATAPATTTTTTPVTTVPATTVPGETTTTAPAVSVATVPGEIPATK